MARNYNFTVLSNLEVLKPFIYKNEAGYYDIDININEIMEKYPVVAKNVSHTPDGNDKIEQKFLYKLIPLLVKAIQEQQIEIDNLKSKL